MRVVIAKKLLSTVGGSEAQARALARALAKRHHEVTLVGLRPAWRRPGIPLDVYAAPPGPVELRQEGVRFLCGNCDRCWHVELGYVQRVQPATCHGCPQREQCMQVYARDQARD